MEIYRGGGGGWGAHERGATVAPAAAKNTAGSCGSHAGRLFQWFSSF